MNGFLESCIKDTKYNERIISDFSFEKDNSNMLLSFPRSGNGWIRVILATFFAIHDDEYFSCEELQNLVTYPLVNASGLKTSVLGCEGRLGVPIDSYVPDIYQYKKTLAELNSERNQTVRKVSPKKIFKTHHLDGGMVTLNSYGIILREPKTCVLSAALLLESDLLHRPINKINSAVEYYLNSYIKYLKNYIELHRKGKAYFIFQDNPEKDIAIWLSQTIYKEKSSPESLEDLLKEIIKHFPLKSGFNKEIFNLVDVESLPLFDRGQSLYRLIKSF